jgi:hypothetical protein
LRTTQATFLPSFIQLFLVISEKKYWKVKLKQIDDGYKVICFSQICYYYLFFLWDYLLINVLILFMFTDGLFVY